MIYYADVPLSDPLSSDVGGWIAKNIAPEQLFPLAYRTWPGILANGPILNPTPEEPRPVIINSLFWPWGACRFARGHFVCSYAKMQEIRALVYSGGAPVTAELKLYDGDNTISTKMWMLPAIPLSQISVQGMYLITLVDDRYWWWGESVSMAGSGDWTDLYAAVSTVLNIEIDIDPIHADYGMPPLAYATASQQVPLILDAIAFSVQQRIVRSLTGAVSAQNVATSKAAVEANQSRGYVVSAGGVLDLNPRQ